jgi:HEAT repeat protein
MSPRPDHLHLQSIALRALQGTDPTPEAVALARQALSSKHEGLRSLAAQALGAWARPEFVAPLRELLVELRYSKSAFGMRRVLVRALQACTVPSDASWVSDFLFEQPLAPAARDAVFLLRALPWPSWYPRVRAECAHAEPSRRRLAALVLSFSAVPASAQLPLLTALAADTDRDVRALGRFQLSRIRQESRV